MSLLDQDGLRDLWNRISDVFVRKSDAISTVEVEQTGSTVYLSFYDASGTRKYRFSIYLNS